MEEADPCTSSTSELVEKSRLRGSLRCQVDDSPLALLLLPPPPPSGPVPAWRTEGAGAELESRARSRGFVAARLGERGIDWAAAPIEGRWRAPPRWDGRWGWAVGDGEWLPTCDRSYSHEIFMANKNKSTNQPVALGDGNRPGDRMVSNSCRVLLLLFCGGEMG